MVKKRPVVAKPPQINADFTAKFPALAAAWDAMGEAARAGPLTEREQRLVKLAVAIGGMRVGAVGSAARRARAAGVSDAEIDQVVALSASTIGVPGAVAAFRWTRG